MNRASQKAVCLAHKLQLRSLRWRVMRMVNNIQAEHPRVAGHLTCVKRVPLNSLYMGDVHGIDNWTWARISDDYSRLNCRLQDSPYAALFSLGSDEVSDQIIRESSYFEMMERCRSIFGHYANRNADSELLSLARSYLSWSNPETEVRTVSNGTLPSKRAHSADGSLVMVRGVEDSLGFEIIDGHHRAAAALHNGQEDMDVLVADRGLSGFQRMLRHVGMTRSGELYQPIDSPMVGAWPPTRKCSDRLGLMRQFISEETDLATEFSYLDVACSYGYFVSEFQRIGADAHGVEIDPVAINVGKIAYDLPKDSVTQTSIQDFFRENDRVFDVVSSFSILHHFVINSDFGEGVLKPEDFVAGLDRITGKVLFLDTGQGTERWFAQSLRDWDADHIERFVLANSGFTGATRLGCDSDGVGRSRSNYGRMLFAFTR